MIRIKDGFTKCLAVALLAYWSNDLFGALTRTLKCRLLPEQCDQKGFGPTVMTANQSPLQFHEEQVRCLFAQPDRNDKIRKPMDDEKT